MSLTLVTLQQEVVGAAGRETITGTGTGTGKVSGKVEERIVIQAKSHGQLESAADKLLSIGDVLVTVNHCEVGSCGAGFTEQLAFLRDAPRPVLLGFVPAVAMRR